MSAEIDMIQRLFEVERESAELVHEAQKKADEKIAEARAQAETRFKEEYAKVADKIENSEKQFNEECLSAHTKAISDYKKNLSSLKVDTNAFEQLVQNLIFA